MSLLIKTVRHGQLLRVLKPLGAIQGRQGSHWYPDYKPEAVPKTEAERIKAAQKYNLLPEEYENYEPNEGYGDYPKLELESVDSRDPYYPWDNPELRKNFNEPVNVRMMNCIPEALSTGPIKTPHWKGTLYFLALCSGSLFIFYLLSFVKLLHPVTEKQYPFSGGPHYSFNSHHDKEH